MTDGRVEAARAMQHGEWGNPIPRTIPRAATGRHGGALKLAPGFVYNPAVAAPPSQKDGPAQRLGRPMAARQPYFLTGVRS